MSSPDFNPRLIERILPNERLFSNPCSVGHVEPSLPPLRIFYFYFIFILFLFYFYFFGFFLCSHVAGNCLRVEHGCYRPSILAPLTHPGLSCIDLRLVSRNGPRMLCCANKLLTNPPHAMTDTKKYCRKGTCSTSKACLCTNWPW